MSPNDPGRWSHRPGLDGLRGLAVVAVVAYHLGYLGGGFLGVDVFLVLSGYLITGLAIREIGGSGHLSLRAFWGRRVRRLLPALLVVVSVVTATAMALGWPKDQLHALGWDGVATLTWWANWRQVQGPSYWASGESLFRHAWSLSIEEQFYVVWPLVLVACAAAARRLQRSVVAIVGSVALLGAIASATWQLVLAHRLATEDLSRVYVGTDARAFAPLLGCALACALAGTRARWAAGRGIRGAGAVGVVVLGWFLVTAEVAAPALYRNGVLIIVSIAAAAAVARSTAVQDGDRTLFGRTVVAGVPRYLGLRSYAIYLWSWPIQVLLSFRFPELAKPWVAAITVAASLALSEVSYRLVECPIRYRTGWAAQDRTRRPAWSAAVLGAAAILVAALALAVPPAAHERVDTAAAAADAMHEAAPAPPSLAGSEGGPISVMLTGDSVAWTIGFYRPDVDRLPPGIASIDPRGIIGCGIMSGEGWGYPQSGSDGLFTKPGAGYCLDQRKAEAIGLSAQPDVVMLFPGAWEWSKVQAPSGRVIEARTKEMAQILRRRLVERIKTANDAGARFVMVEWVCPGPDTAGVRSDPAYIRWINNVMRGAVDEAVADGGRAEMLAPTDEICVDGDPEGEPTAKKNEVTGDEVHVVSREGNTWLWDTWFGPALTGQ